MFPYRGRRPVIHQAFRFSLDPTAEQEQFLAGCMGASRFWFNEGLALVKRRLDERAAGLKVDVPWSYKGLCVAFRGDAIKDELAPSGRRSGDRLLSGWVGGARAGFAELFGGA
jgi:hypothetical protein